MVRADEPLELSRLVGVRLPKATGGAAETRGADDRSSRSRRRDNRVNFHRWSVVVGGHFEHHASVNLPRLKASNTSLISASDQPMNVGAHLAVGGKRHAPRILP